jgi:hypothetical protein
MKFSALMLVLMLVACGSHPNTPIDRERIDQNADRSE